MKALAEWQSGHAADCNSVNIGSIPFSASNIMKILVSGSSGFIGYHLVKKLIKDGNQVIGVDNHNAYYDVELKKSRRDKLISKNFKFYLQDINDLSIEEKNIDLAINLAAQAGVRSIEKTEYENSNIRGFEAFCNFCKTYNIKKIIYASSSSVYSDSDTQIFNENETALAPKSLYGQSKLKNEIYASKLANESNISIVGLRFFSVYGPLGRPDMAYFLFSKKINNFETINLFNNGLMERDMTYIDDVVSGIMGSINFIQQNDQLKNEIFNLGNNNPVLTKDLLIMLENKLNKKAKICFKETSNESKFTNADITKARKNLNYNPVIGVDEGLNKFISWFNDHLE